ncbi:CDK inhibitor PHO81 [Microdochium nivale]|nr:CDK inhibitor PHO81 [Microdochium nivale]
MKPLSGPLGRLAAAGRSSWTCSSCRSHLVAKPKALTTPTTRSAAFQTRSYTNGAYKNSKSAPRGPKGRTTLYAAAATGATGAGLLAFTDDIRNSYEATERAGRVAVALFICINDYRTSLNKRDKAEDPDAKDGILRRCHKRCAERTLKVLEKNGGIFIKLGQHVSAMTYLLPIEWTDTFIPLQDKCPVSSYESVVQMFREDTGEELSDYFSEFSETPIGAASLAQVHLATIKETGRKVAVKIQHPTLARWAPLDISLTTFTFSTLKRFFPEYDLEWLASELEVSLPEELDFRLEAANAIRTKQHFKHRKDLPLVVPEVISAQKRILVMANESGHRLDDLEYLDQNGINRDEVSATLAHVFNEMIFGRDAALHCDPHGGNIAIRKCDRPGPSGKNFEIVLYDHGLYRSIPENLQFSYAKMWLAVIDNNMEDMKRYTHEVAGVTEEQFPLFASAITGRDFTVVKSSILKPRSSEEKKEMGDALQEGLLSDLVQMLGQVPRIILLILKTNDLTRSLDENLQTTQGPVRTFLILARYCAWTVFREQVDELRQRPGSLLAPGNALRLLGAWIGYMRVEVKLGAFELWLTLKRISGFGSGSAHGPGDFGSSVMSR